MQRRQWLDIAAIHARNAALMKHLAHCSAQLDRVVEPLHRAGVPVLLAPMHTVSDVLATLVGANVYPRRATVIVSGDVQAFARRAPEGEWRQRLDYCSIHDDPRHIAGTLSQAMLEAAEHRRNIILFPDITPDYTPHSNQDPAAKLACHLFGRPAHAQHRSAVPGATGSRWCAIRFISIAASAFTSKSRSLQTGSAAPCRRSSNVPCGGMRMIGCYGIRTLYFSSTDKSGISLRMDNTLPTPVLQSEINSAGWPVSPCWRKLRAFAHR